MIFNQTDHFIARGSVEIEDGQDSVALYFPGFKSSPPSLVLTPIGANADVNLFVDDTSTSYTTDTYDLTKNFTTENGEYIYISPTTLTAWWRFPSLTDSSGNGNDVPAWTGGGYTDPAMSELTPSSYVHNSSGQFGGGGGRGLRNATSTIRLSDGITDLPFSIAFWVNSNYIGTGAEVGKMFGVFPGGTITNYAPLVTLNHGDALQVGFTLGTSTNYAEAYSATGTCVVNQWQHIAITYDGTGATTGDLTGVRMYINGEVASVTTSETGVGYTGCAVGSDLRIGMGTGGNLDNTTFCAITDMACWSTKLSPPEVKAIHDVSISGINPNSGWPLTIRRSSDVGPLTVQWQSVAADPVRTK